MGLLFFLLLVILVATLGFWDAVAALLGATVLVVLVVLLGVALVVLGIRTFLGKSRGG